MSKIVLERLRNDSWVNPFNATAEELLAGALEETGLIQGNTLINGCSAQTFYQSYCKKKNLFQEATRLGSLLVKEQIITEEQLKKALSKQQNNTKPLGELLISLRFCTEQDIEQALSKQKTIREELYSLELAQAKRRTVWQRIVRFFFDNGEHPPES
jgi:hypothetical protein